MNAGSRTYSIKDLENHCGIKAHTIRMWEKRYGILTPDRSDSNIRHYTEEELKKLIAVSMLNRNGLKISKIARLNDNELLREVLRCSSGDEKNNTAFKPGDLIMSALRFSEEEFRERLSNIVKENGMKETYIKVFHPLMQKARALWLTDAISRPQEQFIRHEIRSILISEELALNTHQNKERAAIINLSDNEVENNLLFLKYLLRQKGIEVIYTEETLSAEDISAIYSIKPFSVIILNLPASEPDDEVIRFCTSLVRDLTLRKVLVTGMYEGSSPWSQGKTEAVSSPAGLAAWADNL
jgi:DNA-binding transcriptional MerR regulator